jgi:hypothetical protein
MSSRLNRIEQEFVIKEAIELKIALKIHLRKAIIPAPITDFKAQKIYCLCPADKLEKFKAGETVKIFFMFHNLIHTFTTRVSDITPPQLVLDYPRAVFKDLQRIHERVAAQNDIQVYIQLKDKKVRLDFPKTDNKPPLLYPGTEEELESGGIKDLLADFNAKVKSMYIQSQIVMMRNRAAESFEERLMKQTAKMIWIPSTEGNFPESDFLPEQKIVTVKDFYAFELDNGAVVQEIKDKMAKYLSEKQAEGIHSQVFCPILFHDYFTGYIALTGKSEIWNVDAEIVKYVFEFAKILSFALEKNNYFRADKTRLINYQAQIIDISASGLLFSHNSPEIIREIALDSRLFITLKFKDRKIGIETTVIRKFHDNQFHYFGLKYTDLKPEDLRYLFEYLYARQYTVQYKNIWEGGSPPPSLKSL